MLYIYSCQQAGLSIQDLHTLSYVQVQNLIDVYSFVNDAVAYAEDDAQARQGEAAFLVWPVSVKRQCTSAVRCSVRSLFLKTEKR